jgi:hypothetical protein
MVMGARTIGETLTRAARLPGRALCVFGSDDLSEGSVPLGKVDRCVARALYKMALLHETPPVHFGAEAKAGICPGGQGWCGVSAMSTKTMYFVSTGTPDFRNGEAEYLKPDPEAAKRFFAAPGKITPPARYINVAGWDRLKEGQEVLSYLLFGNAESIRNLGGLVQFVSEDIFASVMMPGGPSCSSMITYAAGMAEKAPKNTAFVGPVDPTGNSWFPPEMLSLAIPYEMARKMAENVDASFLGKRPQVAFPVRRLAMDERGEEG